MRDLVLLVPVLGAPLLHAPVLRWDLLRPLERPLDGGATLRGRRLLGDNKTWRGALLMFSGALLATLALWGWEGFRDALPDPVADAGPLALGAVLGAGVVVGELPNSFVKRQLGIAPGRGGRGPLGVALAIWDQADFVPAIVVLLLPIWAMPVETALLAFAVVAVVHMAVNVVGWAIGARERPV